MIYIVGVVTLIIGYLLGRNRPWNRLADWAHDQIRYSGSWYGGSKPKQALLLAAWALTSPNDTYRAFRERKEQP